MEAVVLTEWDESEAIDRARWGTIEVLCARGDAKTKWDRNNPDEVAAAKAQFESLKGKGYAAFYAHTKTGEREGQMKEFDPAAEGLIMVPPIKGGGSSAAAWLPRSAGGDCRTERCTALRHGQAP